MWILSCFFQFDSNYATVAAAASSTSASNVKGGRSNSLKFTIKELKGRIENKLRLTEGDLHSLLDKLRAQKVSNEEALEILQCCSYTRIDSNGRRLINRIWKELKEKEIQFEIQHYKCLLQVYRNDVPRAQQAFDEMLAAGFKADA